MCCCLLYLDENEVEDEAMVTEIDQCVVDIEADKKDEKEMEDFMREGCGCKVLHGSPCFTQFPASIIRKWETIVLHLISLWWDK